MATRIDLDVETRVFNDSQRFKEYDAAGCGPATSRKDTIEGHITDSIPTLQILTRSFSAMGTTDLCKVCAKNFSGGSANVAGEIILLTQVS